MRLEQALKKKLMLGANKSISIASVQTPREQLIDRMNSN